MDKPVDKAWLDALLSLFCQQRMLMPGQLNGTAFRVLAELGRIRNDRILNAMEAHLVQGWAREDACSTYGVNPAYFSRRVTELNRVWQLTEILRVSREKTVMTAMDEQGDTHDAPEV
ncbi:PapB/FocB family fimbrial expression transcriptional regulator [Citrobacter sedlakii]|uniref:PapB/FocB family fimbrial expression transcriptional regulator n=1 Tax=Citrobacter sedlakii TaxID=67826 RepID=UPI000F9B455F|nr:PapB/FocB family fimbrial expression transcriptional regulator [Citrobacter sedlakii]EFM0752308.1 hypothetical protein [Salmonella enterica subsp. enterica serovar Bredeney]EHS1318925.1 hypothetical protein [Salmonella enterica subsp. enterica serovar Reading]MJU56998.1 hypothetical protein [Salmonella enterica subsp. enterica serovar Montevideo]MCZ4677295.1 PapB/FocB family fimbrial expression transcriptional regulator [Citrobacter sedlakii]MDR5007352.1 PapB/FocB family fimbrial expression